MKEFTITVVSDKTLPPSNFLESIARTPAGPQRMMGGAGPTPGTETAKEEDRISSVTLTAHLTDVEYEEAQTLLERMKADAKRA